MALYTGFSVQLVVPGMPVVRRRSAPRSACACSARCPSPRAASGTARRAPQPAPPAAVRIARLAAATARRRNAANVSAPSGVNAPLTQSANQPLMRLAFLHAEGHFAQVRIDARPAIPTPRRRTPRSPVRATAARQRSWRCRDCAVCSAAARACASPIAFSGISTLPCEMPWAFQSVSPCRRNQNAIARKRRPPGTPRPSPQFRPSCCITRCTAGRASMRLRCASQFAGSFMFMRLPPQNST